MEFSRVYQTTAATPQISPCGCYIAYVSQNAVNIRDMATLRLLRLHPCVHDITTLQWSNDSNFLMGVIPETSRVEVGGEDGSKATRTVVRRCGIR